MSSKLVRDVMQRSIITCFVDTPFVEAARTLASEGLESLIVLSRQNRAVGVFRRRELVETYAQLGIENANRLLTVVDRMCVNIPTVPPNIPIFAAAQIMLDQNLQAIYVLHPTKDGSTPNRPVGVLWLSDVISEIVGN